jgi:hypothetical protein
VTQTIWRAYVIACRGKGVTFVLHDINMIIDNMIRSHTDQIKGDINR